MNRPPFFTVAIYVNAFITGAVVMGFEILASRYLFPYFGGSVATWGALIATVLAALMVGYFIGGSLADRFPAPKALGAMILASAAYLALVPVIADPVLRTLYDLLGDGSIGVISAAMALLFPPLLLLGVFSPYAVKLVLKSAQSSGRAAGRVYGVSTLGSIVGTLFTTFTLIPMIGSRNITYVFALCLLISGCSILSLKGRSGS